MQLSDRLKTAGKPRIADISAITPAAILSFSFKKATPSGFAPWRQLPRLTIGALHCTGTVAGGIFRRISKISDPVLLLRRQDYKNYNSKSGAL
jgi:hypothetical protein